MGSGIEEQFSLSRSRSIFLPDSRHSGSCFKMSVTGTSLAVQWLWLCFQCREHRFDPCSWIKPHRLWGAAKKEKNEKKSQHSLGVCNEHALLVILEREQFIKNKERILNIINT